MYIICWNRKSSLFMPYPGIALTIELVLLYLIMHAYIYNKWNLGISHANLIVKCILILIYPKFHEHTIFAKLLQTKMVLNILQLQIYFNDFQENCNISKPTSAYLMRPFNFLRAASFLMYERTCHRQFILCMTSRKSKLGLSGGYIMLIHKLISIFVNV